MNIKEGNPTTILKLYKTRWIVLILLALSSVASTVQWIEYSIIANVVVDYYGVSYEAANWTTMIYFVFYIVFIFPGIYLTNKMGLRKTILIAMVGTAIGACIKVGSVAPDRFWVVLLGQGFVAISQVLLISFPAPLAAVWFGRNEVSTACSIGVFGNQMGIAISFLLPPIIVNVDAYGQTIEQQFYLMSVAIAIACTVMLILVVLFFKEKPPTPPSNAQLQIENEKGKNDYALVQSLKRLMTNPSYVLLLLSYGIDIGMCTTMSTLLNQIILKHYPGAVEDAGRIGLITILAGMLGSLVCGYVLDKFNRFRETLLVINIFSLIAMITFTFTLSKSLVYVYLVSIVLGFFLTGLIPIGFDVAAEITYPESESTTAGLLMASTQVFGIVFIYIYSYLFYNFNDVVANSAMSVCLLISTVLILLMRFDLRRQNAEISKDLT